MGSLALGVLHADKPGKTLLIDVVVRYAANGPSCHDDFLGSDLGERVSASQCIKFVARQLAVAINRDGEVRSGDFHNEFVSGGRGRTAPGKVEQQLIAELDGEPGLRRVGNRIDLFDIDRLERISQGWAAWGGGSFAIERLEASSAERRQCERNAGAANVPEGCPEFMPRHSVIPLHAPSPEILAHGPPLANVNSALSQVIQPACPRLPLALHGARHGRCRGTAVRRQVDCRMG